LPWITQRRKNPCTLKKGRSDKLGEAGSRIPNSYNGARSSRVRSPCRSRWSDLLTVADDRWCEEDEEYAGNDDDIEGTRTRPGRHPGLRRGNTKTCEAGKWVRNITDKPKYKRIAQVQRVPTLRTLAPTKPRPKRNVKSTVSESGEGSESPGDTGAIGRRALFWRGRVSASAEDSEDTDAQRPGVEDKSPAERDTPGEAGPASSFPRGGTERGERRHREERRHRGKIGHREKEKQSKGAPAARIEDPTRTLEGRPRHRDVLRGRERSRVHRDRSPRRAGGEKPGETLERTPARIRSRGDPKGQIPRGPRSQERLSTHNA
ncbi:hypothetical protein KUCAC02_037134, partial [Chaenocephalus aceratus]